MTILTDNAQLVLRERYLLKDKKGRIRETPLEMFRRVAEAVAEAERKWSDEKAAKKWAGIFFEVMKKLNFLPNSPTLMNAGTPVGQLSACFVLPVEDDLKTIFETITQAALIQQKGGGTGFDFSHLRPKGDDIYTSGGYASGPVSFMKVFDAATEHVMQGGKRRGANMGVLLVNHPDIEAFIAAKSMNDTLRNFNISVGILDAFMEAVGNNDKWDLIHPNSQRIVKTLEARKLWQEIVRNAWSNGDPGLLFLDTINVANPTPKLGRIEATNPCGEVPLLPYESCNLGSINLSHYVRQKNSSKTVDWDQLAKVVEIAIRFLDDVVEINRYPDPVISEKTLGNRKIGLGVMGWAEMLIKLGIPYDTMEAVTLGEQVMKFIQEKSNASSASLATARGSFPNWEKSIYYPESPLRHATRTSIAPTGTISVIANTSSSIEPLFALVYQRKYVLNNDTLTTVNPLFLNYLYEQHLEVNDILEKAFEKGTCKDMEAIPPEIRDIFKTALEIPPYWHLRHQIAFQKYTDNAVSKTINLPSSATLEDVDYIYTTAWSSKAKGITVFRDNPLGKQVLNKGISGGNLSCKVCP
ncbi:adenosylcobalamin-dependent ribonucleoside-diphosphate reductase [Negadavirga shengliensis]|uniref:Vitamin B12-dependent ribonucleotide reductase n=1 Tax=Negadavirga shengliensis TaxID=1389218 RepID=A0ABV9SVH8_9BACT